jgi:glutamyl-tRNA reductase
VTSNIFVIGINYRQVPLSERSKATVAKEAYTDTLIEAKSL